MPDHLIEFRPGVLVRQRSVARDGDGGDRAGIYDALDARAMRRVDQPARAFHVALINFAGIFCPKPVIGGDVIHVVHTLHGARERSGIAQIAFHEFDGYSVQNLHVARRTHQDANRMSRGDKLPRHMAAHESGSASNKRLHQERKSVTCPVNLAPDNPVNRRERAAGGRDEWGTFPLRAAQR